MRIQNENLYHGSELNDEQVVSLFCVANRRSPTEIADKMGIGYATLNRILNGLAGEQVETNKWRCEKKYLNKLKENGNNTLNYELNDLGKQVVGSVDSDELPTFSENPEDEGRSVENEKYEDWKLRPHYITFKLEYRNKPEKWEHLTDSDFLSVFYDYEEEMDSTEEIKKELPNGEVTYGRRFFYKGHKIELYERSAVIRIDYGSQGEEIDVQEFWNMIRRDMKACVERVENRFSPLRLQSLPENIEASISTQHWAKLEDAFAEMVIEDEELQDDKEGVLFQVQNSRGELMALVDKSHNETEFEFVDGQEAKNHVSNMKDLIRWGAYYEINPKDFRDLEWLRDNIEMFEEIVDRLIELDEVKKSLEDMGCRLDDVDDTLDMVFSELESIEEQVEVNSDRIDDVVERLDYSMEVSRDALDRVNEIDNRIDQRFRNRDEVIQANFDVVSANISQSVENQVRIGKDLESKADAQSEIVDTMESMESRQSATLDEVAELRRENKRQYEIIEEMNRSWIDKASSKIRRSVEKVAGKIRGVFK